MTGAEIDDVVPIPTYWLNWSDESCCWAVQPRWPADTATEYAYGIYEGHGLELDVVAQSARLDGLDVRLATYRRRNMAHLWIELRDTSGVTLVRSFIDPITIADGAYRQILDLSRLRFRPGEKYRVLITSPTGTEEDAFGVWVRPVKLNRYELEKSLTRFRTERAFTYSKASLLRRQSAMSAIVIASDPLGPKSACMFRQLSRVFAGQTFKILELGPTAKLWEALATADCVIFTDGVKTDPQPIRDYETICLSLQRRGICTIFAHAAVLPTKLGRSRFEMNPKLASREAQLEEQRRQCHFVLDLEMGTLSSTRGSPFTSRDSRNAAFTLPDLAARVRADQTPRVCVVSRLREAEADTVKTFVERILDQSYTGFIDLVVLDNGRSEDARDWLHGRARRLVVTGSPDRSIRVVSSGATGPTSVPKVSDDAGLYILLDCSCLPSHAFVAAHVFEHFRGPVDVVGGHTIVAMSYDHVVAALRRIERCPSTEDEVPARQSESLPQNCSMTVATWNLFCRSAQGMAFLEGRSTYGGDSVAQFNLWRLSNCLSVRLNPTATAGRIADVQSGASRTGSSPSGTAWRGRRVREIEICDATSMRADYAELSILTNGWPGLYAGQLRRLLLNVAPVPLAGTRRSTHAATPDWQALDLSRFDMLIVHLDAGSLAPFLSGRNEPDPLSAIVDWMLRVPDMPKIAVCHGPPIFFEPYRSGSMISAASPLGEATRVPIAEAIAASGATVVHETWQSAASWRFDRNTVIPLGPDPLFCLPPEVDECALLDDHNLTLLVASADSWSEAATLPCGALALLSGSVQIGLPQPAIDPFHQAWLDLIARIISQDCNNGSRIMDDACPARA